MDLITYITEPFQYSFMVRALIVATIISVACPLVGVFVITRGYGFMGDAIAHSIFPGMAIALILGLSVWFGMLPAALVFAFLIGYVIRKTGLQADAAIGILFASLFALGVLVISVWGTRVAVNLEDILLGQILAVTTGDIFVTLGVTLLTLIVYAGFFKELVFVSFDPIGAEVAGIRVAMIDYLLLALISVIVVVTIQAVGVILVLAMLIAPAAAASLAARKIIHIVTFGIGFALIASLSGLYASYYGNLPSGASIALASGIIFAGVATVKRRIS
jgi:manganese/iron transport system permease protein